GGDAIENTCELVDTAQPRQLRVDVHIDEARGDNFAFRVDDPPGGGAFDAVDRGQLSAGDANVQARANRTRAVDHIAAGDEDLELQDVRTPALRFPPAPAATASCGGCRPAGRRRLGARFL